VGALPARKGQWSQAEICVLACTAEQVKFNFFVNTYLFSTLSKYTFNPNIDHGSMDRRESTKEHQLNKEATAGGGISGVVWLRQQACARGVVSLVPRCS
jgi:hypothetical protein